MRILDLASGTGEPAISLAERIGRDGHVTALDLSADLLEIAAKRASDRGLKNFTTQQADAHSLPFPDNSFDVVTSRFGVMFFRDPVMALSEVRRVLRPSGRLCLLAWGSSEQPYWATTMGVVHRHVGGTLLEPGGPDPFRFSATGSLSSTMHMAGFSEVEEEACTLPWTWPGTPEDVWEQMKAVAVPFRPMLERVPADQWPAVNAEVCQQIARYSDGAKIDFGALVILASGRKSPVS
jgi:SAM-dependent methyltransferase